MLPGMFVRVRIPVHVRKHALLVSERALGVDQSGRYLLVVNAQNVVEQRTVTVGQLEEGGLRVIKQGLQGDEWVVVNGIQRTRPGATVKALQQAPPAATAPAEPATDSSAASKAAAKPKAESGKPAGKKQ